MSDYIGPVKVTAIQQSIKVVIQPNEMKVVTKVEQHNVKVKLSLTYVHPASHPAAMITTSADRQFVTAIEKELIHNSTYGHEQQTASDTWIVSHPLNKQPAVSIVDSSGRLVIGDVQYVSNTQLIIKFKGKFAGKAYLN